jgi:NADPH-dependent ferric siderophore reductase
MKGKNVLTKKEKMQMKNSRSFPMTSLEYKEIELKLTRYQRLITDRVHMQHVNNFIPQAADMAWVQGEAEELKFSARHFCRAMNRLTRSAGLRC